MSSSSSSSSSQESSSSSSVWLASWVVVAAAEEVEVVAVSISTAELVFDALIVLEELDAELWEAEEAVELES